MKPFTAELGRKLLAALTRGTATQIDPVTRSLCLEFASSNPSTLETYEFLDRLSKDSAHNRGSLIKVLCNVKKFYDPPEPSDASDEAIAS